jgi:hypothetical protein
MTQALYAHMNNKIIKKKEKENESFDSWEFKTHGVLPSLGYNSPESELPNREWCWMTHLFLLVRSFMETNKAGWNNSTLFSHFVLLQRLLFREIED